MTDEAASRERDARVLVVENGPDDRALIADLRAAASRSRYRLTVVQSREDAVNGLKSGSKGVCLLDYQLDGFTGLELLNRPAARDFDGPVVMLAGNDSHDFDMAAMQAGFADFLLQKRAQRGAAGARDPLFDQPGLQPEGICVPGAS